MIIFLSTVLAIAIIFVIAGLCLSFKSQSDTSYTYNETPYVGRDGRVRRRATGQAGNTRRAEPLVGTRRIHGVGEGRRAYARRSAIEVEQRTLSRVFASLNVATLWHKGRRVHETPWLGLGVVLVACLICSMYILRTVAPNSGLILALSSGTTNATTQGTSVANTHKVILYGASKVLVRVSQVDPNSYASQSEYNMWWPSACSAASMTEVINAYGHHYKLSDILTIEAGLGEITPALGLVEPGGIGKTIAKFNFSANYLNNPSLTDVTKAANSGTPVIVSFPPSRWAGGHILVVIGGDNNYVYLADSSRLNMRAMTHAIFMKYWAGFAVIATPNN